MRALFVFVMTSVLTVLGCILVLKLTAPPPITENFSEKAPNFYVLALSDDGYQQMRLSYALEHSADYRFWLDQQHIALDVGDVHHIRVLAEDEQSQLISFDYINTYSATSTYRVSKDNQLTPLSFEINYHMGQGLILMISFILTLLLAKLIAKRLAMRLFSANPKNSST